MDQEIGLKSKKRKPSKRETGAVYQKSIDAVQETPTMHRPTVEKLINKDNSHVDGL